ncbi:MAG: oligosaccharide flippase family protein [bacterium]|nr:MAG: oligosaccharide flippase family protein [bacterium]
MTAGIIIARKLGPELRGYYGLVIYAVNLLALGQLGLGPAITYYTGKNTGERGRILGFVIASALFLGGGLAVVFFFVYPYIAGIWTDIPRITMLIGLAAIPFSFFLTYFNQFQMGMLKVMQSNIVRLIRVVCYLLCIIILVWMMNGKVFATTISFTLSITVTAFVGLLFFRSGVQPKFERDRTFVHPFFHYGFKAYMITIVIFLNHRLDIFLIKHFLTATDVGFYQIAVNVCERLWLIPTAFGHVLLPTLLTMDKNSAEFTAKVCRNSFMLITILAVLLVGASRFAISLLYGTPYLPSAKALYAVIWGVVAATVLKVVAPDFASRNRQHYTIIACAVGFVLNLAGNLYMIPRYGIIGAGIATSFASVVTGVILLAFFIRQQKIPLRMVLIPIREDLGDYLKHLNRLLAYVKRN